jgi:hypothetical protein
VIDRHGDLQLLLRINANAPAREMASASGNDPQFMRERWKE